MGFGLQSTFTLYIYSIVKSMGRDGEFILLMLTIDNYENVLRDFKDGTVIIIILLIGHKTLEDKKGM